MEFVYDHKNRGSKSVLDFCNKKDVKLLDEQKRLNMTIR